MIFARLAVISLIILNSEVIKGNEISGTFQVCNLQCSNEGETSPPVSDNILRASTLLRGKSGPRGDKGNIGHTGAKGALGEKGEDGRQGVEGSHGAKGQVGRQGLKGEDGTSSTLIQQLYNRITELESDATMIQQLQNRITHLEQVSDVISKNLRPQNCSQIKEQNPEATTGEYTIYDHFFSDGKQVTCDMTSEGRQIRESCKQIFEFDPSSTDGVYAIEITPSTTINVYCDMTGGAWTVFQKRFDGSENFRRNFNEYSEGFGDPSQEHWLGLNNIHQLTSQPGRSILRVDLETFGGETAYAQYEVFNVGAGTDYTLSIGSYSGNAGNSMEHHNGARFSTYDRDQDGYSGDCSDHHNGAWWFTSACGYSSLNAFVYNDERSGKGMIWFYLKKSWTMPMKTTTMKMKTI